MTNVLVILAAGQTRTCAVVGRGVNVMSFEPGIDDPLDYLDHQLCCIVNSDRLCDHDREILEQCVRTL